MTDQYALPSAFNSPFVSYAQNFEDVMLWRALRNVEGGFYVDVGAQSPESDSVTKAFSLLGWRGINIEPHPTYFEQLRQLRPRDVNLDVAIGAKTGSITMNFLDGSGLSTADPEIASLHAAAGHSLRAHEVKMVTLADVWRMHVPYAQEVQFLKIDVEGLERAVLAGNDWKNDRPWIVLVEATLPNSQIENYEAWEPILLDARYLFVYADGLNRFYVSEERSELAVAFKYPPNVFDSFTSASLHAVERELSASQQRVHELRAEHVASTAAMLEFAQRELTDLQQRTVEQQAGHAASSAAALESAQRELTDLQQRTVEQQAGHAEVVAEMEHRLHESRIRIGYGEKSLMLARQRELDVQDRLDFELAALRNECDRRAAVLGEATYRAEGAEQQHYQATRRAEDAEHQLDAVIQSPWWRLMAPGRVLVGSMPKSLRRQIRRLAKVAWWIVTPWRIRARLRYLRARKQN